MDGSTAVAAETTAAHFDVFPWNHAGRITDKISRDKQSLASASKLRAARDSRGIIPEQHMRRRQKKGCRLSRGGGRLARLLGKVDQVTMPGLVEKFMHPTDMYSIWIAFVLHIHTKWLHQGIQSYSYTLLSRDKRGNFSEYIKPHRERLGLNFWCKKRV